MSLMNEIKSLQLAAKINNIINNQTKYKLIAYAVKYLIAVSQSVNSGQAISTDWIVLNFEDGWKRICKSREGWVIEA